ncbi:hypothetical protein GCM10027075_10060 [Streptomyces heilongjiangensis]
MQPWREGRFAVGQVGQPRGVQPAHPAVDLRGDVVVDQPAGTGAGFSASAVTRGVDLGNSSGAQLGFIGPNWPYGEGVERRNLRLVRSRAPERRARYEEERR